MATTAHNTATVGEIAKTVLMPGDPLRSRFIAEMYLKDARMVNNVRGVQGYTGTWKGTPVTVMASGMGIPSIGIYSHELYHMYDVDNIIRVGSAGGFSDSLQMRDIVFAMGACTDSNYAAQFHLGGTFAPIASWNLLRAAVQQAEENGLLPVVGNVLSTDAFYNADPGFNAKWKNMGVLAVEMETAGLYLNAAEAGKQALTICTITDHLFREEYLSPEEREVSLTQMIELALDVAHTMEKEGKNSL